jgi:hypothetical protein
VRSLRRRTGVRLKMLLLHDDPMPEYACGLTHRR